MQLPVELELLGLAVVVVVQLLVELELFLIQPLVTSRPSLPLQVLLG